MNILSGSKIICQIHWLFISKYRIDKHRKIETYSQVVFQDIVLHIQGDSKVGGFLSPANRATVSQ